MHSLRPGRGKAGRGAGDISYTVPAGPCTSAATARTATAESEGIKVGATAAGDALSG